MHGFSLLINISLALIVAFVAGLPTIVGHLVGADLITVREAFSLLFFVSVGMLVNPLFLWENLGQVLALTFLVVGGKLAIVILLGARTLVTTVCLSSPAPPAGRGRRRRGRWPRPG